MSEEKIIDAVQNEELPEEIIYEEEMTWSEVIHSVFAAFSSIENIDYDMASEQDKMRIKRIKRKGLKLIDIGISEIYSEKMYTDETIDNNENEDD
jgi:hypothetical protein